MGLFSKSVKSCSNRPVRPYPKSFASWEVPSTFATVTDSVEFQAGSGALFAGRSLDDISGAKFDDWAYLIRECNSPGDYAMVYIWAQGHFIRRLGQVMAGRYVVEMNGLDSQGLNLVVSAHLWTQRTKTRPANQVTLSLPPVGAMGPMNFSPKRAFTILPPGDEVALEDFEDYMRPLRPFISTGKTILMVLAVIEEQSNLHAYLDKKTYAGRVPDM